MGILDFLTNKKDNNRSHLLKRIETIAKNRQELYRRQSSPFYRVYPGDDNDYSLHPDDVSGKEDIIHLSKYLLECVAVKSEEASIHEDIIISLFRKYNFDKLKLNDEELYSFYNNWKACKRNGEFGYNIETHFNRVVKRIDSHGLTDILKRSLELFRSENTDYLDSRRSRINEAIEYLLQERGSVPVNRNDKWGMCVLAYIDPLPQERQQPWQALFTHCQQIADKSTPTVKWTDTCKTLLNGLSEKEFASQMIDWLSLNRDTLQAIHKNQETEFLRETNHNLFKALVWCTGLINDSELQAAVDDYATQAYKKKPGVGPLSMKTGTACMYAFSMLPFKEAVTRLMKFRNRITNNTIIKSIDKIISHVAAANGYNKDLVEEIGVMDFGLDSDGTRIIALGDVTGSLHADPTYGADIIWQKENKTLKNLPASLKTSHNALLKTLKNEIKEIDAQLSVQKNRIESYYLQDKNWNYNNWIENYIDHPLVRIIAQRLIWSFNNGGEIISAFCDDDRFIDVYGRAIDAFNENTTVSLWHPIHATVDETVNWRNFLQQKEIIQPFKQAYREVYVLTEAELNTETYSNRFAAHILRQHQFAALCRQRGWRYNLMGNWDSHNTPTIEIPRQNMVAQFLVNADWNGEVNEQSIFLHIATDQVRFFRGTEQVLLANVPALLFSEIMRDVDLFVGVTSIGNDPSWTDSGDTRLNAYWRGYSFGELSESAKVRSEVLRGLIPRLRIKDKCSFDGKFLKVRGQLRTYKIHMGSGNILMEPNDQYLCIVPASAKVESSGKIFLPFEGDGLLSIIISKALLLAEDDKIADSTIRRQIVKDE